MIESLNKSQFDIWSDQNIEPGQDWGEEIENSLRESDIMIIFVSPHTIKSQWVMAEWGAAIASQKRIIPVAWKNTPVPAFLQKYLYIQVDSFGRCL